MLKSLSRLAILFMVLSVISCQKNNDFVENKVPVADAGSPKTITLPDSVVVTGTGADADGKVVAYLWSQVSGPASSNIVNPGSPSTAIKFSLQGNYVFQLMVTDDKGATGVDTVSVVVNPVTAKTLTLQPANNPNEFNLAINNGVNQSGVASADLPVEAWTINGNPFTVRSLLKFDLSSIPASATILSSNLYLYSYPSPTSNGNLTDANFGTSNAMYVQQVTANWSPGTATWANQPSTTTTGQVTVPTTTTGQSVLDLNLDVTAMVNSMVSTSANYGFMLKLQNEVTYNSRIFVASHNSSYPTKYPKLVVVYK
ncbi:MAG TPA: DNRLRE domain-containing protein [Niastella sp.]